MKCAPTTIVCLMKLLAPSLARCGGVVVVGGLEPVDAGQAPARTDSSAIGHAEVEGGADAFCSDPRGGRRLERGERRRGLARRGRRDPSGHRRGHVRERAEPRVCHHDGQLRVRDAAHDTGIANPMTLYNCFPGADAEVAQLICIGVGATGCGESTATCPDPILCVNATVCPTAYSVCGRLNGVTYCWQYSGPNPGTLQTINDGGPYGDQTCGSSGDPSWT